MDDNGLDIQYAGVPTLAEIRAKVIAAGAKLDKEHVAWDRTVHDKPYCMQISIGQCLLERRLIYIYSDMFQERGVMRWELMHNSQEESIWLGALSSGFDMLFMLTNPFRWDHNQTGVFEGEEGF